MWIVAGPNGAGKTTFAGKFLAKLGFKSLKALNADVRTLELRKRFPDRPLKEINLQAAIETDKEVEDEIRGGRSFLVETVLSSPKYRDDVLTAKSSGYKLGLIYISLYPPDLAPLRISERTAKGGHDVETSKAIERYHRSHSELQWFAPQADSLYVLDNSSHEPVLVAQRSHGGVLRHLFRGINPTVDAALDAAFPVRPIAAKPNLKNE